LLIDDVPKSWLNLFNIFFIADLWRLYFDPIFLIRNNEHK
jgi:hypothetical protein